MRHPNLNLAKIVHDFLERRPGTPSASLLAERLKPFDPGLSRLRKLRTGSRPLQFGLKPSKKGLLFGLRQRIDSLFDLPKGYHS